MLEEAGELDVRGLGWALQNLSYRTGVTNDGDDAGGDGWQLCKDAVKLCQSAYGCDHEVICFGGDRSERILVSRVEISYLGPYGAVRQHPEP